MEEDTVIAIRWSLLRLGIVGALVEGVWTVDVGIDLPRHDVAIHWDLAGVGLDIAQITMWWARRGRGGDAAT